MLQSFSYYQILQVTPQSSDEEIKRAYRRLALRHHPDRNPKNRRLSELRFRMITEAYAGLRTSEKREQYNQSLLPQNDNQKTSWLTGFFRPVRKEESKRI